MKMFLHFGRHFDIWIISFLPILLVFNIFVTDEKSFVTNRKVFCHKQNLGNFSSDKNHYIRMKIHSSIHTNICLIDSVYFWINSLNKSFCSIFTQSDLWYKVETMGKCHNIEFIFLSGKTIVNDVYYQIIA